MRIGEFAKKHEITIDTIRHYMDLQLLLPDKKGGHYFFGEKEEKDLKEILELKKLKFTLSEIRRIVGYLRLSQLRAKEDKNYIKNVFLDKQKILNNEKKEIENAIDVLKSKVNQIDSFDEIPESGEGKIGIYLYFMQYLSCPICDIPLELEDGKITSNMIMEGSFRCKCGYNANVEDGIYISLDDEDKKKVNKEIFTEKVKPATTLGEYAEGTESSMINHIYKSIDSIIGLMDIDSLDKKIILEVGTGSGFFMRQIASYMNPDNIYIIIDHNIDMIKRIKEYVEKYFQNCKFVFICSDLSKIPIKNHSVDYIINYLTSLNYNLKDNNFLDNLIIPKIKRNGKLIGSSYYLKSGSKLLKSLPAASRIFFEESAYKNAVKNLPLNNIKIKELGSVVVESKYEIIIDGRELYTLVYYGEGR